MANIQENFFKGTIKEVSELQFIDAFGFDEGLRTIEVVTQTGEAIEIDVPVNLENESDNTQLEVGNELVIVETIFDGESRYDVQEPYRLDGILLLFFAFIALAAYITGRKGLYSILGLFLSLLIIIKGIIPYILNGGDPLFISILGSIAIASITFYLSHGFKKHTSLALLSTVITLIIAFILSLLATSGTTLFGTGTEEAIALNFGGSAINLKGLLLGAIVIGTLGILDDVTITQMGTVQEIHKANKKLDAKELYKRGIKVGKDHIASIVNTLVLAYAGASFPVLILLASSNRPFWVSLNSEFLAEEVVRTLVGSMTLMIAIPIATYVGAHYYAKSKA